MPVTPMMQQYRDAKDACPEALLLFRMGDFYELFFEDAKTAAAVLNLALTSRDKGADAVPMAGFPHHQLESYLARLLAAGLRVAVCDQVEDPRQAKGLVRREVTRVVTAGTITDEALLDPRQSNYLAAVVRGDPAGLAWVDVSTGTFVAADLPEGLLAGELARIAPVECLLADDEPRPAGLPDTAVVSRRPGWAFSHHAARDALTRHFGTLSLEGFGFASDAAPAVRAAGAILEYLAETQKSALAHIDRIVPYRAGETLAIDDFTRRSLEIVRTLRDGHREGSLLDAIDRTVTPMGARALTEWLAAPLTVRERIEARLEAVAELVSDLRTARAVRDELRGIYDLERLLARAVTRRATPRDLSHLGRTLRRLPAIRNLLAACRSPLLTQCESKLDPCDDLRSRLDETLEEDCPLSTQGGGYIRAGASPQLDDARDTASGGKQWIAQFQAREVERTGIPNLKVGFNKVFGYYIEITNSQRAKVPPEYHRKQTIKNSERYITPELKEHEEKVLAADQEAQELELALFEALREQVAGEARRLKAAASVLARVDVLAGLAELARDRAYCRPRMVDEPVLDVVEGRHPVLDRLLAEGTFVPNDVRVGPDSGTLLVVTGPNMAGKSTYIRQAALVTLLAHIGSFVPATGATIGVTDRIFARVGASDELTRGQSTFMVEMTETARILNTATQRSLVVFDEIGRGTSTYDGLSLAWAVAEHVHDRIGCRTLFATHFHELTDLASSLARVRNLNVAVREWQEEVVFLHKIVEGAADKSYGIHVARLAGIPREVLERAKQILSRLEQDHLDDRGRPKLARRRSLRAAGDFQLTLFALDDHPVLDEIKAADVDSLTPLAALALVKKWQNDLAAHPSSGRSRPPADAAS